MNLKPAINYARKFLRQNLKGNEFNTLVRGPDIEFIEKYRKKTVVDVYVLQTNVIALESLRGT
jgi:hypothetical protein